MDTIDVQRVAEQPDATLIDVREPDEYAAGHARGARLLPLAQVEGSIASIPDDGPVYVICASGRRSAKAAETMRRHGIAAVSVEGGTQAWAAEGLPMESGA